MLKTGGQIVLPFLLGCLVQRNPAVVGLFRQVGVSIKI